MAALALQLQPALPQDLKGNSSLGVGGHAAFVPLQAATRLTYLGLALCGLTSVPQQLRSMASLAQLKLSWNEQLGQSQQQAVQVQLPQQQQHGAPDGAGGGDVQDPFEPLLHLTSITLLEMKCCALVRIPQHVSGLQGRAQLLLGVCESAPLFAAWCCISAGVPRHQRSPNTLTLAGVSPDGASSTRAEPQRNREWRQQRSGTAPAPAQAH